MPLDPSLEPLLEGFAPFMTLDWDTVDPVMARQMSETGFPGMEEVAMTAIQDLRIPTSDGEIDARLYRPTDEQNAPVILFFHGGGWVLGTVDNYDGFARVLARDAGCAVISVGYRLAPEHPYPAAPNDCYAALEWVAANAENLGLDGSRIAVTGDSAGGNLSTAVCVMARDRCGPVLRHQGLFYPVTDHRCDSESYRENDRYLLTPSMMRWYWKHYTGNRPTAEVPLAAPAHYEDLEGLPPATVVTAEYDPLRDEGEAYGLALARAGVPTEIMRAAGMVHGYATMIGVVPAAETAVAYMARRLSQALRA